MAKQEGGDTLKMVVAAKAKATAGGDDPAIPDRPMMAAVDVPMSNTGLHIPTELLTRLRIATVMRVARRGYGRPSVSELNVAIVERHVGEVED